MKRIYRHFKGLSCILLAAFLLMSLYTPAFAEYADHEDPNYIVVEKRFTGIAPEQIPEEFRISVSSEGGAEYTLDGGNTAEKQLGEDGSVIWRWKLVGVGIGTYHVSESGEEVQNYSVIKSGEGIAEVKAADFAVSVLKHETTCSHTNWPVAVDGDSNVLFAATLTQGGVAVISKTPLSASQRAAVSKAVLKINGPWKNPVYFYSIEEQMQSSAGFELNRASITYDPSAGEVIISSTSSWQHVAAVGFSVSEASNPEISLSNTYQRSTVEITVGKTVTGSMGDTEKSFDFTVTVTNGDTYPPFELGGTEYTGSAAFSLMHGEEITLNIPAGASVTVSEREYRDRGYFTSYSLDGADTVPGSSVTILSVEPDGHRIVFTNSKDAVPDTGVFTDTLPYILILCICVCGGTLAVLCRCRQRFSGKGRT